MPAQSSISVLNECVLQTWQKNNITLLCAPSSEISKRSRWLEGSKTNRPNRNFPLGCTQNSSLLTSVPMVMMKEQNWPNPLWTHLFAPAVWVKDRSSVGAHWPSGNWRGSSQQGIIAGTLTLSICEDGVVFVWDFVAPRNLGDSHL